MQYYSFSLLGLVGAIFANTTGAGGGVVFIPMFHQLGFSEQESVATSFAIQSFGMTAGAVTWFLNYRNLKAEQLSWRPLPSVVLLASVCSVIGLSFSYQSSIGAPVAMHHVFSAFSVFLGIATLYITLVGKPPQEHQSHAYVDYVAFAVIGLVGGVITAWLSVGVGELLAVYLILRGYKVTLAIAAAVIVSAITVWSGLYHHIWEQPHVVWPVVLFAGPAAVLGGIAAKTIVGLFHVRTVKLFFGGYVLISGVFIALLS
ncbi:sulfite exporter TauE/SafE family protein [Echinimonas agarilytica]|uniref:sulfite exporter TauE/SafE family protein n=1 Tax=Echinimonas agarilytica TaxID=1215918 RepID=UPI00203BB148|nr:sulfite exporter TauE/SafE family protein [Echinimonas agarilytica]